MEKYDREKLTKCNGQDEQPMLVVFDGKVYDVSGSPKWKNGKHMARHSAGTDLTVDLKAAPHGPEVFDKFEQVGVFVETECAIDTVDNAPYPLNWLYKNFPIIKRHAHPVSVHFPIAFMLGSCLFCLLYLFFKQPAFESTAFHLILLGTVTAPFSIITGLQSWWLYYGLKVSPYILIKLIGGPLLIVIGAIASILHLANPNVLIEGGFASAYFILIAINVPLAMGIGAVGGQMTFPD